MKYKERIEKVETHLKSNPNDYQSVISLFKLRSAQIEHDRKEAQIKRLREISKYRRMLDEEHIPE